MRVFGHVGRLDIEHGKAVNLDIVADAVRRSWTQFDAVRGRTSHYEIILENLAFSVSRTGVQMQTLNAYFIFGVRGGCHGAGTCSRNMQLPSLLSQQANGRCSSYMYLQLLSQLLHLGLPSLV